MKNPKSEIRNPKSERNPNPKIQNKKEAGFDIGYLIFEFLSDFGFRISDFFVKVCFLSVCLLTTACQQEMARQPSYQPLERTDFFAKDNRASRPLVEGTVPWRGRDKSEPSLLVYRRSPAFADAVRAAAAVGMPVEDPLTGLPFLLDPGAADYVDVCPIAIDKKALERGRDRFNIYCAVCHDTLGTGNGKIVERGYLPPPNYHTDHSRGFARRGQKLLLREVPIGYFFDVITRGYGGMPDYASQIPPDDRWKIAAYIRVLQRSQWTVLNDLSPDKRDEIRNSLPSAEERK